MARETVMSLCECVRDSDGASGRRARESKQQKVHWVQCAVEELEDGRQNCKPTGPDSAA